LANGTADAEALGQRCSPSSWSPDGRWIACLTNNASDIALVSLDSKRTEIPVANTEFVESHPAISPDGKWLAYVSNESGRFEIYVRSLAELASVRPGKWPVSRGGGTAPRWSRDGRELYYMDLDNQLVAVTAGGQEEFQAGTLQILFRTCGYSFSQGAAPQHSYDVASDGRFLINCLAEETAISPITVVINWMLRLKQ
jgi:Tol biopolymer transport system component